MERENKFGLNCTAGNKKANSKKTRTSAGWGDAHTVCFNNVKVDMIRYEAICQRRLLPLITKLSLEDSL